MHIEVAQSDLKGAVSIASRFVSRQATLEALRGILCIAEGKTLTLRATNLECGIEISIPAKITDGGLCAVPGATLSALVGNMLNGGKVTLSSSGNLLKVETERSSSNLKTLAHEDFPILPTVSAEHSFSIKAGELARVLRMVAFCASVSGIKPELQSVMVSAEGGLLTAAATDSFRLAEKSISLKGVDIPRLLIPIRNAAEMIRLLEEEKGDTEIYYSDDQLSLRVGEAYFTTRLINGTFPNYKAILPSSYTTEAVVLREDLAQSLKALSLFADSYAQVGISVAPKKRTVTLSSRNTDVGEHTATLSCAAEGEAVEMHFNGRYVADALSSITSESVRLGFNGTGKPLAMLPAGDASFVYIVMPMNR